MRVFVDVGAHYGETLDVALDPRWGFDRVFSLEPAQACLPILRGYRDDRLSVVALGLSNRNEVVPLYRPGLLGATVYADKVHPDREGGGAPEEVELVRASEWLEANTAPGDEVFLKLNCEGSEVDVLDDLVSAPAGDRVRTVYVDFDVRKIPSQAHRQAEAEDRLRARGIPYATPDAVGAPGNAGVERWLAGACPRRPVSVLPRLRHRLRLYRPPYMVARSIAERCLPKPLFAPLVRTFGRHARAR